MANTKTNEFELNYVKTVTKGVTPSTGWRNIELNTPGEIGATLNRVPRNPISKSRQRRKGVIVSLDSGSAWSADAYREALNDFLPSALYARHRNYDGIDLTATTTTNTYTVSSLSQNQTNLFRENVIIWGEFFDNSSNNGRHIVSTNTTLSGTTIGTSGIVTGDMGLIGFAGYSIPASVTKAWRWSALTRSATLSIANARSIPGLYPGQLVRIGSIAQEGGSITNAFRRNAANDINGWCFVKRINTSSIEFYFVDPRLRFDDTSSTGEEIHLSYGTFVKNVRVDDMEEYVEDEYVFEASYENQGDGTPGNTDTGYEYSEGNYLNTLTWNIPLADKSTFDTTFVGTDTPIPTTTSLINPRSNIAYPNYEEALNTGSDIARLVIEHDDQGLATDFKNLTITINNGVTGERVLGNIGPRYINTSNLLVDVAATTLYDTPLLQEAIRLNETASLYSILRHSDGVYGCILYSMTLAGGTKGYPEDARITIDTSVEAFRDRDTNSSFGYSFIPVPLPK